MGMLDWSGSSQELLASPSLLSKALVLEASSWELSGLLGVELA